MKLVFLKSLLFAFLFLLNKEAILAQATASCTEKITWVTPFEAGKPKKRIKQHWKKVCENKKTKEIYTKIEEEQEWDFSSGELGRELQYAQHFYDAQGRLRKTVYRHGYEGNDGGEGEITFDYQGDTLIEKGKTATFSFHVQKIEQKGTQPEKPLLRLVEARYESELLPQYNYWAIEREENEFLEENNLLKKTTKSYKKIYKDAEEKEYDTDQKEEISYSYRADLKIESELHSFWQEDKKTDTEKKTYFYDTAQRLIREEVFSLTENSLLNKKTYTYLGQTDSLLQQQEVRFKEEKPLWRESLQREYDAQNRCVKEYFSRFKEEQLIYEAIWEYTYLEGGGKKILKNERFYYGQGGAMNSEEVILTTYQANEELGSVLRNIRFFENSKTISETIDKQEVSYTKLPPYRIQTSIYTHHRKENELVIETEKYTIRNFFSIKDKTVLLKTDTADKDGKLIEITEFEEK
ncbi:hypothetical protein [Hugenholtzia roseola]|uniref:hypothetical protein n=1 Tax=Hugenholtzia roseola TaxID=1002 RepID=UPI0003FDA2D9|nr:hypothetical protein [Hugenholtzia roseola]